MIELEREGALWRVVIDRPGKANALTAAMLADLLEIVTEAHGKAKVLVLTGRGRVFSAGADLDEARAGLATSDLWESLSGAIAGLPCLTIAALNGTLAGGAFGMALACDMRICVEEAEFFYPVVKLGFLPQPSDPARLARLVGPARAKMILLAGSRVNARQALAWGLVERITTAEELEDAVAELAAPALAADAALICEIKRLIG